MMGWGGFADKVMSWFTPEQRVRRIKSQLHKLEKEKNKILKEKSTYEKANKLMSINARIGELERMLKDNS